MPSVDAEMNCDARNLVDPPPGECRNEQRDIMANTASADGQQVLMGSYVVNIPFLDLEQGEEVLDRLAVPGASPLMVIQDVVGFETYPGRQFTVNLNQSIISPASIA